MAGLSTTITVDLSDDTKRVLGALTEALNNFNNNEQVFNTVSESIASDIPQSAQTTVPDTTTAPADTPEQDSTKNEYSVDDVRVALKKLSDEKGRECAKKMLSNFGANKLGELSEDMYDRFIVAVRGEMNA